jgi:hypothetical protein
MNRREFIRYTIAGSLAAPRASAALMPGTIRSGQSPAVRNARATTARIDAHLRSLSPRDLYQWMEYCNIPARSTTLAAR